MNIFEEVKARVSAKAVAESYGLKIGRNGMEWHVVHFIMISIRV